MKIKAVYKADPERVAIYNDVVKICDFVDHGILCKMLICEDSQIVLYPVDQWKLYQNC